MNNPLKDSGLPLFFKVANPDEVGIDTPPQRMGDSLRTWVRSLSHMQKEAIVRSSRTGVAWRLASDEGAYLDGLDEAPCPLSFLTTGMVSATMNEIVALAKQRGIKIRHLRLIQDNYYTMKGSMLRGTMTGGAEDVRLEAQIDADADSTTLQQLVEDAVSMNPLSGLMREALDSLFALSHNGTEMTTTETKPLNRPLLKDPGDQFARAQPLTSPLGPIIVNTGKMTPKESHTTGFAGSSLAEEQNRLLHVKGICTLREDGVKEIEQHLYNPHGSIFRFLSEEAPEKGGQGRAPDANTYISAGIAFCFMTQFGRAAVIFKKELDNYRIIQDTHFSLAGGSDNTGLRGEADEVETHCYLESGYDDDYAQHVLGMAEQTCFLHAFCRTDLITEVRISSY
ncbi:OsmC family protein [Amphritea pacifica]|uniref:OsmC family protein n=1 Tax=Amphritea pacifica TaxID=2811233 RepID=A0ABS2W7Q0_9GAMM|nr:OsmC family protein [Amphritea pacifica]MBN0987656.1 OsmC family protein [Amphritea pacifica]MBN1009010.1 OsmC family protein [Amphritea pacifica]